MTIEVEIGGIQYRTMRMNARTQFHVARRILPVLASLEVAAPANGDPNPTTGTAPASKLDGIIRNLASAIGMMSDADCDYVLAACLTCCQRKEAGGGWMVVWNAAGNQPQFADLDLPSMIQLTVAALQDNLGSFLAAPMQGSPPAASLPSAP